MRKSSLGRRSSTWGCNVNSSTSRSEMQRSQLLQPGFTNSSRRVSSEERYSLHRVAAVIPQSVSRSRSDQSLLDSMPTCTPVVYRGTNALPTGSSRPSRSRTSSVESNRISSSIGSVKSSKRECRPVNDKDFQIAALRKVQEFFQRQPNCLQLLDNSMNIRPMTLKKFINMVEYLLRLLDERIILTKDNYIEVIIKTVKLLNYGGKLDRSWLVVVNAPHAWCHVIAFLVWLVDLINIQDAVSNNIELIYPGKFGQEQELPILEANIQHVQPYLTESYNLYINNGEMDRETPIDSEEQFELLKQIEAANGAGDRDIQFLEEEAAELQMKLNDPDFCAEKLKIQQMEEAYNQLKEECNNMRHYAEQKKLLLETKEKEASNCIKDNEQLLLSIENLTKEKDRLKMENDTLNSNLMNAKETNKERSELKQTIDFNQKCIQEVSKSIFEIEVTIASNCKQMEAPLIEYNKLINMYIKHEHRLKSCIVENMHLFAKPDIQRACSEADKTLESIKNDWVEKINSDSSRLKELELQKQTLEETTVKLLDDLERSKDELASLETSPAELLERMKMERKCIEETIKTYKEKIKNSTEKINSIVIKDNELEELKERYGKQRKEIDEAKAYILDDLRKEEMKLQEKKVEIQNQIKDFCDKILADAIREQQD